jgi:hypothetical protein
MGRSNGSWNVVNEKRGVTPPPSREPGSLVLMPHVLYVAVGRFLVVRNSSPAAAAAPAGSYHVADLEPNGER